MRAKETTNRKAAEMAHEANRREFMKGLLAGGALIATSRLPALDDPALFPKRGKFERLSLSYARIAAGAEKPFSLLHISDTHFTAAYPHEDAKKQELMRNRTRTFGGRQEEALRDSLAWAKANTDFVLHTGDMIDWVSEANLDLVKKYFGKGNFGAVGNHEYSRYMWLEKEGRDNEYKQRSAKLVQEAFPFDIRFDSNVVNGVNFITMDTVYGYVDADQAERFEAEVKKGLPIVIGVHVPFYTPELWRADVKYWSHAKYRSATLKESNITYRTQQTDPTTKAFIERLKREPLLKGILAGHMHVTVQDRFSPTAMQYVVGGNFAFQGREVLVD